MKIWWNYHYFVLLFVATEIRVYIFKHCRSDCPFSRRMLSFSHQTAVWWSQRIAGPLKWPLAAEREGETVRRLKMMKCFHGPSWWTGGQRLGCNVMFPLLSSSLPFSLSFKLLLSVTSPHQRGLIILSISTWGKNKIQQREQRRWESARGKPRDECVWLLRNCLVELRLYFLVCVKVMVWKQEEHETTFSPYFHLLKREITSNQNTRIGSETSL